MGTTLVGSHQSGSGSRYYSILWYELSLTPDTYTLRAAAGLRHDYSRNYNKHTVSLYCNGSSYASNTFTGGKGDTWGSTVTVSSGYRQHSSFTISLSSYLSGGGYSSASTSTSITIPAKDSSTLTFQINTGEVFEGVESTQNSKTVITATKWYNEDYVIENRVPTKVGYTFKGWDGRLFPGDRVTGNATQVFISKFQPNTNKIFFDANNGTFDTVVSVDKVYDSITTLTDKVPTREYYKFLGWSTDKNDTTAMFRSSDVFTTNITSDLILYAVWELESVNVYVHKPIKVEHNEQDNTYKFIYGVSNIEQGVINTDFSPKDLSIDLEDYTSTGKILTSPQTSFIKYGAISLKPSSIHIDQIQTPYNVYVEIRDAKESDLDIIGKAFFWVDASYTLDQFQKYIISGNEADINKKSNSNVGVIAYVFQPKNNISTRATVDTSTLKITFGRTDGKKIEVQSSFSQINLDSNVLVLARIEHPDLNSSLSYAVSLTSTYVFGIDLLTTYIVDSYGRPIVSSFKFEVNNERIIYDIAKNKRVLAIGGGADDNKQDLLQTHWPIELVNDKSSTQFTLISKDDDLEIDNLSPGVYFVKAPMVSIFRGTELKAKVSQESIIYITEYDIHGEKEKTIYVVPLVEPGASHIVNRQSLLNEIYPIGSVYMNITNTKPDAMGMQWSQLTGRVLIGSGEVGDYWEKIADEINATTFTLTEKCQVRYGLGVDWEYKVLSAGTYTIATTFTSRDSSIKKAVYRKKTLTLYAGEEGGTLEHSHKYGIEYGEYYGNATLFGRNAGVLNNGVNSARKADQKIYPAQMSDMNKGADSAYSPTNVAHYRNVADTSAELSYPPYKVVNMWVRIR